MTDDDEKEAEKDRQSKQEGLGGKTADELNDFRRKVRQSGCTTGSSLTFSGI